DARKIVWGRYAKVKGAKAGDVAVTRQGNVWIVKGRIDSVAPGSEGDWASVDGVVEKIAPGLVQVRGDVARRGRSAAPGRACLQLGGEAAAERWWRQAADDGEVRAQIALGSLLARRGEQDEAGERFRGAGRA